MCSNFGHKFLKQQEGDHRYFGMRLRGTPTVWQMDAEAGAVALKDTYNAERMCAREPELNA